ncbi:hypothetical protein vseg_003516 [Gypsophila vaccaria]
MQMRSMKRKGHQVFLCSIKEVKDERMIEDIHIFREFSDVFPDELPGVPPVHDVKFSINLLQGTAPISKAPYKMTHVELQELKKQLEDMIDKGFIRPSVSP